MNRAQQGFAFGFRSVAGYYRHPADSTQPGAVTVTNGAAVGDVDLKVNFDSLRPATDFVTCTTQ